MEQALEEVLQGLDPNPRERALAYELVYGVCRWRNLLDHYLAALSNKPLNKLSPEVLILLRLGTYQVMKLDRVPDRAAVHATVEEAARSLPKWKSGFVNAVLRNLVRGKDKLKPPDRDPDLAGYLAATQSHPRWLVERWIKEFGPQKAEALLQAHNRRPGLCLRINPLAASQEEIVERLNKAGLEAHPGKYSPQAVVTPKGTTAAVEEALGSGGRVLFQAQSEAAQTVAFMVAIRPGWRILDLCAGVGGKTLHLAELTKDKGAITALEISAQRAEAGAKAVARAGLSSIRYLKGDALKAGPDLLGREPFEAVLIDAPCSGSGVLATRPDIRWRLRAKDPARTALQDGLLEAGASQVAPGGVLVYATCSLFKEENQDRVQAFLARHLEFEPQDPRPLLPETLRPLVDGDGFLHTDPAEHGLEGFFGARMVKAS